MTRFVSSRLLVGMAGIVAGVSLLLTAAPSRAETYEHAREGWFLGLGVGAGNAGFASDSDRETGAAGSFRAGYALNDQWGLGLESNAWRKEVESVTFTFNVAGPAVYYYPAGSGLVLRGGVGIGSIHASASSGSLTVSASDSGLGLTVGAGYDFRIKKSFSLGPQVDFGWMSIDSGGSSDEINYVNVGLSFDWHFLAKQ